MKLYKILAVLGHHAVSVFPPEEQELPESEEMAGEPITRLIRQIMVKGYTNHEARLAIEAWAYHAKYDLNQAARGVRVYCEMCAAQIPLKPPIAAPWFWGVVLAVAAIVAVALGLYVWAVLDPDYNVNFGTHPWAYLMMYEEHLWQGENFTVGWRQRGYYELGGDFGLSVDRVDRNVGGERRKDWIELRPGSLWLEGRKPILYHVYRFTGFRCYFCGVLTEVARGLYKIREGGGDPYKPRGPWSRPGTRWGTPDYEGCWQRWWWL